MNPDTLDELARQWAEYRAGPHLTHLGIVAGGVAALMLGLYLIGLGNG